GIRDFHVTGVQTCALPIFDFIITQSNTCLEYSQPLLLYWYKLLCISRCIFISSPIKKTLPRIQRITYNWPHHPPETYANMVPARSEERRVGKEGSHGSLCA